VQFTVHRDPDSAPTETVLRLEGELDLIASSSLGEAMDEALQSGAQRLVLDLGGLTFIDSSGLRTVLRGREDSAEKGVAFLLRRVPSQVRRVFEITGMTTELEIEPD
jgi:anti-anti-sigma factor